MKIHYFLGILQPIRCLIKFRALNFYQASKM